MGSISDKLLYLNATKTAIANAIISKGGSVGTSDTFRSYADKISNLSSLVLSDLKTCNISYNHQSTVMSSPATLPNSEPASPQVSYTLQQSYFPVLTGNLPQGVDYVGFLLAGCINNNTGFARTLNWRVKRNGTGIGNGYQSVAASNKAVLNFDSLSGTNKPVVGDVLEIYLWCTESASDMQINRKALGIIPVRFKPINNVNKLLMFLSITAWNSTSITNFTQNYAGNFQSTLLFMITNTLTPLLFYSGTTSTTVATEHAVYGIETSLIDTAPANSVIVHASNYVNNTIGLVSSISWKETNIRYNG